MPGEGGHRIYNIIVRQIFLEAGFRNSERDRVWAKCRDYESVLLIQNRMLQIRPCEELGAIPAHILSETKGEALVVVNAAPFVLASVVWVQKLAPWALRDNAGYRFWMRIDRLRLAMLGHFCSRNLALRTDLFIVCWQGSRSSIDC